MQNQIPVPTDNIYKFYALFSLLLLIFSLTATLYVGKSANELILNNVVELETLSQEKNLSSPQQVRKDSIQRMIEVSHSDKQFYLVFIAGLISISGFGMFYGFKKWHTEVQPVIDETAKVQLEIAKLQLAKLKDDLIRIQ